MVVAGPHKEEGVSNSSKGFSKVLLKEAVVHIHHGILLSR